MFQAKSPKLLCVCAARLGWTPVRDVSLPHVSATGSSSPRTESAIATSIAIHQAVNRLEG
ncbi:hypothetical protein [Nostoc sp.]|uniref:hypothetical protein n=1 Tax=Nostoc sp. TaxID=1180 RepID=UPI002FFC0D73